MNKLISTLMTIILSALAALMQGCGPAERPADEITISGTVLAGGAPLSGVVLPGLPGNPVTGANGAYSVTVATGFSGTVTPDLTGYAFDPASRTYANLSADRGAQNYTATLRPLTISGTVSAGSAGIAGVTMAGLPGTPVTDATGHYSAQVSYGSTVTVIPTHALYSFDPASNTHTNVTADISGQDYAASLITTAQRRALIAFYDATGGDGWTNKTGWKDGDLYPDGFAMPGTEGTWYGLTVDPGTQQVTRIDLPDNNLAGSLPSELDILTSLTYLILSGNLLTGPIPAEIGGLTALRELVLSDNGLTGSIPAEIGNATALEKISLSDNQLTGSIPATLGNLMALYRFYATNNQLSGPLPAELGGLPNLAYVYLNTNQLSGPLPAELGNMPRLVHLSLYSNELSGPIPPELCNATNLQSIVLRDNHLSGEIPAELGNLTDLLVLRLGDNLLTGAIPAELGNATKLRTLRLSHNQLSGEIPATLGNLTQLWEMLITGNKLSGPIPASLMNLTALTATDLGYNALYSSDETLVTFLNSKDANWAATQTIAPASVTATSLDNAVIAVSWLPVTYTSDPGFYNIYMSQTAGGPYTLAGSTADKATASLNVTGLTPAQPYYFVVRTVTSAHADNSNVVESGDSNEATAVASTLGYAPSGITGTDPVTPAIRIDFNNDGREDILWRYYGPGGYNRVWFLGNSPMPLGRISYEDRTASKGLMDPCDLGLVFETKQDAFVKEVQDLMAAAAKQGSAAAMADDPRRVGEAYSGPSSTAVSDPRMIMSNLDKATATAASSAPVLLGGADILPVDDATWEIAAAADFDKDTHADILWRHNGPAGETVIWLMNGTDGIGGAMLPAVPDPGWKIAGTGDFNNDTYPDILWRYYGSAGTNLIWYMRGTELIGTGELPSVQDPNWQIVGTGDFNKDGHVDVLWRYNGAGGYNLVWHLNDTTVLGSVEIVTVGDPNWQIAGTGDYNKDGNIDILWRFYGPGGYNCIWYMDQVTWIGGGDLLPVTDLTWTIANR